MDFSSKAPEKEIKSINPRTLSTSNPPSDLTLSGKRYISTKTWGTNPAMKVFIVEDQKGEISYIPALENQESSQIHQIQTTSNINNLNQKQITSKFQQLRLRKILKNLFTNVGIFKNFYFLINLLEQKMSIPSSHILMCLKKIRLNNTFRELADEFFMTPMYAKEIFFKNVPVLARIMRNFIVKLENLHNVSCIIDYLEIEIEKPLKASNQSLTWSEHKKANTIKYLVSCNPNGLVNYVSKGYGGRITDTYLVQSCDFTKFLQPRMCVLVNRDFKHLEESFLTHGVQLIRSSSEMSKESQENKQYARLKRHIETVIGNLQVFNMLKPNACLNHKLVKILDDVVTIACGLINFHDT